MIIKKEAREIPDRAEELALIHMSLNKQEKTENMNFMCNCDRWHCGAVKNALAQPKQGLLFNSGFEPRFDPDLCIACETCVERCPSEALTLRKNNVPEVGFDRCFGCAVCATGCPSEAIVVINKPDYP